MKEVNQVVVALMKEVNQVVVALMKEVRDSSRRVTSGETRVSDELHNNETGADALLRGLIISGDTSQTF